MARRALLAVALDGIPGMMQFVAQKSWNKLVGSSQ